MFHATGQNAADLKSLFISITKILKSREFGSALFHLEPGPLFIRIHYMFVAYTFDFFSCIATEEDVDHKIWAATLPIELSIFLQMCIYGKTSLLFMVSCKLHTTELAVTEVKGNPKIGTVQGVYTITFLTNCIISVDSYPDLKVMEMLSV